MSEIAVTLPDGSVRKYPPGVTIKQVAESIGPRLGRDAIGGVVDGSEVIDVHTPLQRNCAVKIVTVKSAPGLEVLRHSASHIMASAVQRLFPGTQVTFGPAVENGFYYDFRRDQGFTPEDLAKIEAEMKKIVDLDLPFERSEISREEAKRLFEKMGETFKREHIDAIPPGETLTLYKHGDWLDLCKGPHVPSTGLVKAFRLTSVSGAYWKGDERNPQLARIYGTAFWDQKALDEHFSQLEEAKKRDHRKLGKELDLFSFNPVAPGMPFFHPKGAVLYNTLIEMMRGYYRALGFDEVITPQVVDFELYKRSGHSDNYRENMYAAAPAGRLAADQDDAAREYGIKPMNCPGHMLLFAEHKRSYRELPLRLADFGRLHRYERSGVIAGLTRVRSFAQDDAHVFCREDQVEAEVSLQIAMIRDIYAHFGFESRIGFGTRPPQSIGRAPELTQAERSEWDELWQRSEAMLQGVLKNLGIAYEEHAGDGAFYGPKVDFDVRDALGRWHQLGTIQLDRAMPRLFDLKYTNSEGGESRPVVIHRAVLGSLERFIGILIEHTGGDFPLWLAPVQVRVLAVNDDGLPYAAEVAALLHAHGVRVWVDRRSEKLGFKIRDAELHKVPVVLVVGDKEKASGEVSVRWRKKGDLGAMTLDRAKSTVLEAAAVPSPSESLRARAAG